MHKDGECVMSGYPGGSLEAAQDYPDSSSKEAGGGVARVNAEAQQVNSGKMRAMSHGSTTWTHFSNRGAHQPSNGSSVFSAMPFDAD